MIAGAILIAMGVSIIFLSLKIDALEAKLDKKDLEIGIAKDSLVSCQLAVTRHNESLKVLKAKTEEAQDAVALAKLKAERIKQSHKAEIERIENSATINTCEEGMQNLLEEML